MIIRRELSPKESQYRLPSGPCLMEVTPDMASDWLTYRNPRSNRKMSNIVAERYRKDMTEGRWLETPQGYSFDSEGWLIDGQHRLRAQANANVTLKVWVFPDQPRETFGVFDAGYRRTPAHLINAPYSGVISTGARYIATVHDGDAYGLPRFAKVSTQEILDTVEQWPELTRYGETLHNTWRRVRIPSGPHAAVLALAARTEYESKIPEWLRGVSTGEGLEHGDPRLILRDRYSGGVRRGFSSTPVRDLHWSFITKAWNAFAAEEPVRVLRHLQNEQLPQVRGFSWTDPDQTQRRVPKRDGNLDDA